MINLMFKSNHSNVYIPLTKTKVRAWWLLWNSTSTLHYSCICPTNLLFIKGSCFQNVQCLTVFKLMFSFSVWKTDLFIFILLSETSHASYSHFNWCTSFVINQTSKDDSFLFFFFFFHKSDICYVQSSTCYMLQYITNMNYFVINFSITRVTLPVTYMSRRAS